MRRHVFPALHTANDSLLRIATSSRRLAVYASNPMSLTDSGRAGRRFIRAAETGSIASRGEGFIFNGAVADSGGGTPRGIP